jgi:type IV secretion system protein VirB4
MWFGRKSNEAIDLEAFRDIADDVIESDFVPYACLYDANTVITKNGQLIQIIKISGLNYDTASNDATPLRTALRNALRDAVPSSDYGIWLHTMRRRVKLTPEGDFPEVFARALHEKWRDVQQWDNAYINEVYISIVKEHQAISWKNPDVTSRMWLARTINSFRSNYLESGARELTRAVDAFCGKLGVYSASRLGMVERQGTHYHEGLEFLEKLINLRNRPIEVSPTDLSKELTSSDITFGYNAMEVRLNDNNRRFAAILTIKEYKEASLGALDQFLEIPCEVIISQCFDFVGAKQAKEAYELQHRYLKSGGDTDMMRMSEVVSLFETGKNHVRDFGEHQLTMFVIASTIKELETNLRMIRRALTRIGIVAIREDMYLEDCYWSQLPGNLRYMRRMQPINTAHLGGFISLQSLPMGNALGSEWGPPVSLFSTVSNTPYFFNFHRGRVGHTTLIGGKDSGKTTLLHFLIAQSRKLKTRIWYIDTRGKTDIWATAMGATHYTITGKSDLARMAPLARPDTPEHRDFLSVWLTILIDASGKKLSRSVVQFFRALIDQAYNLPPEARSLANLAQSVAEADMMLASELTRWVGSNAFGQVFDNKTETMLLNPLTIFDISAIMPDDSLRAPIAAYLLQRMTESLDGTPTIIVLDEAWQLLANPLFAPQIDNWLDHLTDSNAMMIATTEHPERSAAYPFANIISAKAATQVILPERDPEAEYMTVFGLSAQEMGFISQMRKEQRHVMVKRGRETAIITADLAPLGDALYTLASTTKPIEQQVQTAEQQLAILMGWKGGNAA